MAATFEDAKSKFRECEVVYKGILHPKLGEGDRAMVRTDAVDENMKMPAKIISVRMFRKFDMFEFLVHFDDLPDRRYDMWVMETMISDVVKAPKEDEAAPLTSPSSGSTRPGLRKKRPRPGDEEDDEKGVTKSLEEEARQYEEYTKIKYISEVQCGQYLITTWYFSPFAREFMRYKRIHVCPTCLYQFVLEDTFKYHYALCPSNGPPGHLLYCTQDLAIYEVDGVEEKLYCQLLSVLGKCFIKEKTLVHYVDDFKFYVLCELKKAYERERHEIVGFFSKEKRSEEGYNLACLVILPPFMKRGYGSLLIDLSYHISRRERKLGTPERPLSSMGRKAYLSYWSYVIVTHLVSVMDRLVWDWDRQRMKETDDDQEKEGPYAVRSIYEVSEETGIDPDDIRFTLLSLEWPVAGIEGDSLYLTPGVLYAAHNKIRAKYRKRGSDGPLLIHPDSLSWPVKSLKLLKCIN